jgi:hypothetical protein
MIINRFMKESKLISAVFISQFKYSPPPQDISCGMQRKVTSLKITRGSQLLVAHTCNPLRRERSGGSWFEASPRQIVHKTLFQKNLSQKRAGVGLKVQVLSSNPSTTKKKKP